MPLVCGIKSEVKSLQHLSQAGFSQISCVATAAVEWGGEGFIYRKTGDIRGSAGKESQGLCLAVPVLRGPCKITLLESGGRKACPDLCSVLSHVWLEQGTGLGLLLDNFCACRVPNCQDLISWNLLQGGARGLGTGEEEEPPKSFSMALETMGSKTRFGWGCEKQLGVWPRISSEGTLVRLI